MTKEEIAKIYELKDKGYGYKKIASALNAPLSMVKSIIIRHKTQMRQISLRPISL